MLQLSKFPLKEVLLEQFRRIAHSHMDMYDNMVWLASLASQLETPNEIGTFENRWQRLKLQCVFPSLLVPLAPELFVIHSPRRRFQLYLLLKSPERGNTIAHQGKHAEKIISAKELKKIVSISVTLVDFINTCRQRSLIFWRLR